MSASASSPTPFKGLPLAQVLPAISSPVRCAILRELAKGESLPNVELARRLRTTPSAISKHFSVLYRQRVVSFKHGRYVIASGLLSDDRQSINFGCLLIRLNHRK
ncbi:ArsR/SmtB family transcription factor [Haloferula chungangensis]|uniref:ArsR/SmtB family transcription factor n=1 Tax=Haloferula chungangensis TaxID=1048331 RepID=A0ABW2LDB7_9BACT